MPRLRPHDAALLIAAASSALWLGVIWMVVR